MRVYQWFSGLDLSDKFLVFSGKINTPMSWNERDRTVKVTAVSQIEDIEIGFSAEEGDFPYIPSDLMGKPWPMIFGTGSGLPGAGDEFRRRGRHLNPVGILTDGLDPTTVDLAPTDLSMPLYDNGTVRDQQLQVNLFLQSQPTFSLLKRLGAAGRRG